MTRLMSPNSHPIEIHSMRYGYYFQSGMFLQYRTKRKYNRYSDQHWKIHINYPLNLSATLKQEYLSTVLLYLQTHDLSHKIVSSEENMRYRMNDPDSSHTQNGKFITIYCNSEIECYQTMDQLDRIFRNKGYIHYPLTPEQRFRNDRLFRNNPFIGYRYASSPRKPYYVIPTDENGQTIEDIQEKYDTVK